MKYLLIIMLLVSTACGFNGKQVIQTTDSRQDIVQSGEARISVTVELAFISQLWELCQDLHLQTSFETQQLWKQQVAQCVFDNLSIININPIDFSNTLNQYCAPGADLSQLTPEQLAQIQALCAGL